MARYQHPLNIYSFAQFVDSVKASRFLEIDLRPFDFIDVYATMGLALLVRSSCCDGHYPKIHPPKSDDVKAYLARQDFFEVISPWYGIPQEYRDLKVGWESKGGAPQADRARNHHQVAPSGPGVTCPVALSVKSNGTRVTAAAGSSSAFAASR